MAPASSYKEDMALLVLQEKPVIGGGVIRTSDMEPKTHIDNVKIVSAYRLSNDKYSYAVYTVDLPQWHQVNHDEKKDTWYVYTKSKADEDALREALPSITEWHIV